MGIPLRAKPEQFADAWSKDLLSEAADQLKGTDGVVRPGPVSGRAAVVSDNIADIFESSGASELEPSEFIDAGRTWALAQAEVSAGADGRIAHSGMLPHALRADMAALRSGRVASGAAKGKRFSPRVLGRVLREHNLSDAKAESVVDKAAETDDNRYLNTAELRAAAASLGPSPSSVRYSANVAASVLAKNGLDDLDALIAEAVKHDSDGNRYLKRSELEAAAKVLSGQVEEMGIISDLDKTLIWSDDTMVPGSRALLNELEFGPGGTAGDVHYVTARTAANAAEAVPWLAEHGLPDGTMDSGVNNFWAQQGEKVKDISKHFDANPNQKFVLFGDSSHKDPEVYTEIRNKYPDRVVAAFIHKVNNVSAHRVVGLQVVDSHAHAAAELFERGVFTEAQARKVMVAAQLDGLDITDAQIDALIAQHQPE